MKICNLFVLLNILLWGNYGLCVNLPLQSHGRKLMVLGGNSVVAKFAVAIKTRSKMCTGFIFKPGFALTASSCINDSDEVLICTEFDIETGDCVPGTKIPIYKVINLLFGTVLLLAEYTISGIDLDFSIPPNGTNCEIVGFSGSITTFLSKPTSYVSRIIDSNETSITLESVEGKDVCFGDLGGPLICNGKAIGLFNDTNDSCNGSEPVTAIPLKEMGTVIEKIILHNSEHTYRTSNVAHTEHIWNMFIFPVTISCYIFIKKYCLY